MNQILLPFQCLFYRRNMKPFPELKVTLVFTHLLLVFWLHSLYSITLPVCLDQRCNSSSFINNKNGKRCTLDPIINSSSVWRNKAHHVLPNGDCNPPCTWWRISETESTLNPHLASVLPIPSIHQVSDGIKHIVYYQIVIVIQRTLEGRVVPQVHLIAKRWTRSCYMLLHLHFQHLVVKLF